MHRDFCSTFGLKLRGTLKIKIILFRTKFTDKNSLLVTEKP